MLRGQRKNKGEMEGKKERNDVKNSPISFVTTARSSARHWVGCLFQARPEWTGCDAVGQAELQPGVPSLCMTVIGEMREREKERRMEGSKGRKGRMKEGSRY